jgi:TDG/mug DNA glycosylase family protein
MLPDLLDYNLKLVFCGTAAGEKSAQIQAYYAGQGNKFWDTLFRVGLTDKKLTPGDYKELLNFNIGLTDLVKNKSGMDSKLVKTDFGNDILQKKIVEYKPKILCFNGKKAAKEFLQREVNYGIQQEVIGNTIIYVAPSTSNSANGFWDISYWQKLKELTY